MAIGVFLSGAVPWADNTFQRLFSVALAILCAVAQTWLWLRGERSQPSDGPGTTGASRIARQWAATGHDCGCEVR